MYSRNGYDNMKFINKKVVVIALIIVECFSLFLTYKSFFNKQKDIGEVVSKKNEINKDIFAILIENTEGKYEEYSKTTWPTRSEGYVYNATKSGCIDSNGNALKNVLTYNHNIAELNTNKTTYCYLYFDKVEVLGNVVKNAIEDETIYGGMYRYRGADGEVDNYICFGTSNTETCVNNPDEYMYRIIGVDSTSNRV